MNAQEAFAKISRLINTVPEEEQSDVLETATNAAENWGADSIEARRKILSVISRTEISQHEALAKVLAGYREVIESSQASANEGEGKQDYADTSPPDGHAEPSE